MPIFGEDCCAIEKLEAFPMPEGFYGGVSTRVVQAVASDGASYILNRSIEFNRVIARATLGGGGRAMAFAIYQAPNGGDGIANLVALDSSASFATGNWVMSLDGSVTATLNPGIFYLLYSRSVDDTAATMRVYSGGTMDLQTANVDSGTHPLVFTSALTIDGVYPATMNPRTDLIASTLDLALTLRLKKV